MPEGWGWNLDSMQALGSIATVIVALGVLASLTIAARAAKAARDQANAVIRDNALRTRPWVGLTGVQFSSHLDSDRLDAEELELAYLNVGQLPAESVRAHLELTPVQHTENPGPIVIDRTLDLVFPGDPRKWQVSLLNDDLFTAWRLDGFDLGFSGYFRYQQGSHGYTTYFQGIFWFSEADVPIEWDNVHVE